MELAASVMEKPCGRVGSGPRDYLGQVRGLAAVGFWTGRCETRATSCSPAAPVAGVPQNRGLMGSGRRASEPQGRCIGSLLCCCSEARLRYAILSSDTCVARQFMTYARSAGRTLAAGQSRPVPWHRQGQVQACRRSDGLGVVLAPLREGLTPPPCRTSTPSPRNLTEAAIPALVHRAAPPAGRSIPAAPRGASRPGCRA